MARVCVEARALAEGRLTDLADELKMPRYQAMGLLVFFWHDSQARGVWKATRDKLERFIPEKDRRKEVFDAMLKTDYISESTDGEFVVRGNRKNIEALENLKSMAQRGGEASARSRAKKSKKPNDNKATQPCDEPSSILFSSTLFSSTLLNSNKNNSEEGEAPDLEVAQPTLLPEKAKQPSANAGAFIAVYCRLWKKKYGTNPVIAGKDGSTAKSLVRDIGSERAASLVESYLEMNDSWFIKKRHDLWTFASNLNAVAQYHDTGKQILGVKANEIERATANSDTWDRAAEYVNEKLGVKKWT